MSLLLVCCVVAIAVKIVRLPYTIALVLSGLGIALLPRIFGIEFPLQGVVLTSDMVFYLILPPLLFQGALNMDINALRRNFKTIVLLAIPGILLSTFVVGGLLYAASVAFDWGLDVGNCILFGALIAPTDPISVLAIFKKMGVPQRLRVIVEGESLFNDGTGIVIFGIVLMLLAPSEVGHSGLLENMGIEGGWVGLFGVGDDALHDFTVGVVIFIIVAGLGAIVGYLAGTFTNRVLRTLDDKSLEVTITIVLAFGVFMAAEFMSVSGVIAVVIAGLLVGNIGKDRCMRKSTLITVETFWESTDFMLNSVLFLLIGLELQAVNITDTSLNIYLPLAILVAIAVVLLARATSVALVVYIKNIVGNPIKWSWAPVIIWGGLRGSIPLALVLSLSEDFQYYNTFLVLTFSVVLFSLVVQGLTMAPLLRKLVITGD